MSEPVQMPAMNALVEPLTPVAVSMALRSGSYSIMRSPNAEDIEQTHAALPGRKRPFMKPSLLTICAPRERTFAGRVAAGST